MTFHHELIPFVRMFVGDLTRVKFRDDIIMDVLTLSTGVVQILGYDKGHVSNPSGVSPDLSEKEKILWGKCASVMLQDPKAQAAAAEAVSIRTLGTSYSNEGSARLLDAQASEAFTQLRLMIRSLSATPLVGTPDNLDIDTQP